MTKRVYYFEDLSPGTVLEFGHVVMTAEDIIDFGRRFDPQPFHVDPEAAKASLFGGLCASGWHTASVMMRLCVDNYLSPEASLGSPGVDELRWLRPVFAGDRLSCRVEVLTATPSRSRPFMGSVRSKCEVLNQHGDVAMSLIAIGLFRRREAAVPAGTTGRSR
jgi:acyl dehydratase